MQFLRDRKINMENTPSIPPFSDTLDKFCALANSDSMLRVEHGYKFVTC